MRFHIRGGDGSICKLASMTAKGLDRKMEFIRKENPGILIEKEFQAEDYTLPYLQFPNLKEVNFVTHLFTTRAGGVSKGKFESLNLSFSRGDDRADVMENYRRAAGAMGGKLSDFVCTDQTHTTNVRIVTERDRGKGITRKRDYTDIDGLITNVPGIILTAFFADCVPIYIVDPVHKAIGLAHSGWRGTVSSMGQALISKMYYAYGTRPEDCLAAIGPSICGECYEVGEDVAGAFRQAFEQPVGESEKEAADQKLILYKKRNGKYQLDLWRANELVLLDAGVLQEHICLPDICTCCNPGKLFSHRASRGERGNLGAFLKINK